ncbi:hexosaminidase D-like [Cimex lectularius]|uniref:beta-N-acetylhexosaminidase n=1 Tax=Cimex lectularius TaxID=79782 RepID=A0A8I6S3S3_CIMLE|nr:hexosaminidase D-like [Cimex lectularius]
MHRHRFATKMRFYLVAIVLVLMCTFYLLFFAPKPKSEAYTIEEDFFKTEHQEDERSNDWTNESSAHGLSQHTMKVVHLDFKGGAPTLPFLGKLLPKLAKAGCNALLVEYEDMFPYNGILKNVTSKTAYSEKEIREILKMAKNSRLDVIPYLQVFGNLEFLLKVKDFAHLREFPPSPWVIATSNQHSLTVIKTMIAQVMEVHKNAKYIHLGAGEVETCLKCRPKNQPFLTSLQRHLLDILEWMKQQYPYTTPIIWDWIFSKEGHYFGINTHAYFTRNIAKHVQPMIFSSVGRDLNSYQTSVYALPFRKVWVAGAFRGLSISPRLTPDLKKSVDLQMSWMKSLKMKKHAQVVGYVLMGNARRDHFAVLGELLPLSLPSLFINLVYIQTSMNDENRVLGKFKQILECKHVQLSYAVTKDENQLFKRFDRRITLEECIFPGSDLFNTMLQFELVKNKVDIAVKQLKASGWFTFYHIAKNVSNTFVLIKETPRLLRLLHEVKSLKHNIQVLLWKYTDTYSANEWVEQNIYPLEIILIDVITNTDKLVRRKIWSRRPM